MKYGEWDHLHGLVTMSIRDVLASVGIDTRFKGTVATSEIKLAELLSVAGFGGAMLRGSIAFSVPVALLRRSHPVRGAQDEDLADWLAELTNLLLGQIKRRLLAKDCLIEVSLPVTLSAPELRFKSFAGPPAGFVFEAQGDLLHAVFGAVAAADEVAFSTSPPPVHIADAGEMVTF